MRRRRGSRPALQHQNRVGPGFDRCAGSAEAGRNPEGAPWRSWKAFFDALCFPALWRTQSTSSHAPAPKSAASMPMSCQPTHLLGHYTHGLSMLCVSTIMLAIRAKPSDGPSHRTQVRGECQNIGGDVGLAASIGDLVLPEPRRCWSCLN